MSLLGLFLCTLARPAFTVFIPALCIAEYLSSNFDRRLFQRLALYFVTALVAVGVVGLIQYSYTGAWFECFKAQKLWGNELQLPKFPLSSWAGGLIVRLDAAAFCIGLIAASFLTSYIFNFKKLQELRAPKEVLFAIAYLAGISILVLFLRGGVLASMSRYVISTPCIIIALDYYLKQNITFSKRTLGFIFVGFLLFFLCFFEAYVHIQVLLKFALLSAYLCLLFGIKSASAKGKNFAFFALIAINIFFQAFFWIRFLDGGWVS
jgi:hypothetical protein